MQSTFARFCSRWRLGGGVVGQERMTSMRSDTGRRVQGDGIWPIKRFDAWQRVYVGSLYGVLCVYLLCWVSASNV